MRILTASDRALLVEASDLNEAMRLHLAWDGVPGVVERIPGARTVLVRFDPLQTNAADLAEVLMATEIDTAHVPHVREVTIPVRYDGEDLAETARILDVSAEELIARHLAADWQVAFSGFAPGFGYAVSNDPLFDVPRRSSPRTRVPAGSVALAGQFTGVYPRESPGGWQLIGRTDAVMWDIDREPPALLSPGTQVRFERGAREFEVLPVEVLPIAEPVEASGAPVVSSPSTGSGIERVAGSERVAGIERVAGSERVAGIERVAGGETDAGAEDRATVEIVMRSLQLLVQDAGRPGHAALGVSASGVADRRAMREANHAVGNAPGAAVLESVGGAALRFHGTGVAAVTGAIGELTLTDAAGEERPILHGEPFATADGDVLSLNHPGRGVRYVIGLRGGLAAASALGSLASDTLAGLGPTPLVAGDMLRIGDAAVGSVEPHAIARALPASGDLVELEITLGPRDDWFTASALENLRAQEWTVTPRSDRVGIRLQGQAPLERATQGELPSEGAVTGAIQVPPDGQPVLFLADHPLTGGYPIIGALTDRCLDLAAQMPPGVRIRFRVVERSRAQ